MATRTKTLLNSLSTADLKRLLAARERIDVLERERDELRAALDKIEAELAKLITGAAKAPVRRKPGRPRGSGKVAAAAKKAGSKPAKKKTVKKKAAKKKTVKKVVARKASGKKVSAKKSPGKRTSRPSGTKTAGRVRLEDVIVDVISRNGGAMPYKDLFAKVVKGKLFATKSGNFDNVMRRTLSTSKRVKRVGRGVYDVA